MWVNAVFVVEIKTSLLEAVFLNFKARYAYKDMFYGRVRKKKEEK
jgi:hypothetical protein